MERICWAKMEENGRLLERSNGKESFISRERKSKRDDFSLSFHRKKERYMSIFLWKPELYSFIYLSKGTFLHNIAEERTDLLYSRLHPRFLPPTIWWMTTHWLESSDGQSVVNLSASLNPLTSTPQSSGCQEYEPYTAHHCPFEICMMISLRPRFSTLTRCSIADNAKKNPTNPQSSNVLDQCLFDQPDRK